MPLIQMREVCVVRRIVPQGAHRGAITVECGKFEGVGKSLRLFCGEESRQNPKAIIQVVDITDPCAVWECWLGGFRLW